MSIRLRFTLLYTVILALTLAAFSLALYLTLSQVTLTMLKATLADEAQRLIHSKAFQIDSIDYPAKKFAAPETYVQTLTPTGQVADRSPNLGNIILPLSPAGFLAVQRNQTWSETAFIEDKRLLIYSAPVKPGGQTAGILLVARSLADQDQSLNTLRTILIIGSSVVTLLAFGVGWVLAGLALRPINRITQTAQAIGAERDFDRRVSYTGPADEVGHLATTFNAMLTELQAAYRQVEQTLQAQRRFVADASHELRTPLTSIRGNLGLLQRQPPIRPEDRVAVLTDMVDETERLMRLVNDLLVLARVDAGQALQLQPVAIKPLVEEVYRQIKLLNPDRNIETPHLFDVAVWGNRDALKQVLLILLDNALKFTPPDGKIVLTTAINGRHILLSVQDTGVGIEAAALPHIFERFYRSDASRTGTGAGLGLAIAKALVEAQDGAITVESQVGQGSVFIITLRRTTSRLETPLERQSKRETRAITLREQSSTSLD